MAFDSLHCIPGFSSIWTSLGLLISIISIPSPGWRVITLYQQNHTVNQTWQGMFLRCKVNHPNCDYAGNHFDGKCELSHHQCNKIY